MCLVLSFFTAAGIWLLLRAEFLAIVLVLVYVGAVMVLFLFVVMMLDVDIDDAAHEGSALPAPRGPSVGALVMIEMRLVLARPLARVIARPPSDAAGIATPARWATLCTPITSIRSNWPAIILLVAIVAAIALTLRQAETKHQTGDRTRCAQDRVRRAGRRPAGACPPDAVRRRRRSGNMIAASPHLRWRLSCGAILFAISVAGIFLNRKNIIAAVDGHRADAAGGQLQLHRVLALSGDLHGQVFVFFILTVAAAESAIGLAILVVLFRNVGTIDVEELDKLKG